MISPLYFQYSQIYTFSLKRSIKNLKTLSNLYTIFVDKLMFPTLVIFDKITKIIFAVISHISLFLLKLPVGNFSYAFLFWFWKIISQRVMSRNFLSTTHDNDVVFHIFILNPAMIGLCLRLVVEINLCRMIHCVSLTIKLLSVHNSCSYTSLYNGQNDVISKFKYAYEKKYEISKRKINTAQWVSNENTSH